MNKAILRLQVSKEIYLKDMEFEGMAAGKEWAEKEAEYGDLLALSKIDAETYGADPVNVHRWISEALDPNNVIGSKDLPEHLFGTKQWPEPEWLVGWIEGAQDFFEGVKDKI